MQPIDEDAILATVELVGRCRARDFELGYLNDEGTQEYEAFGAQWYAEAKYQGHKIVEENHEGPTEAAEALARRLLTGAKCKCGKLVTLSDHGAIVHAKAEMADGSTWTREEAEAAGQCRWTRMGAHWKRGCE